MKSWYKFLLFFSLFALEFLLLKYSTKLDLYLYVCIIFVFDTTLMALIVVNNRTEQFRSFVLKIFRNIANSLYGILAIVYFLAHLSWMFDSLTENLKEASTSIHFFWMYLAFFPLPYLILTLFIKKENVKVTKNERKVFFSALSLFDRDRNDDLELTEKELSVLYEIKNFDFNEWSTNVNWQPIFNALKYLTSIEEVVLFTTKEVQYLRSQIRDNDKYDDYDIDLLIRRTFTCVKSVKIVKLDHPNDLQDTIDTINICVRRTLKNRSDRELVFSLTGGTAIVSGAMSMIATKGHRGVVYKHQQNNKIVEMSPDVFDIKELWEEIINKYE